MHDRYEDANRSAVEEDNAELIRRLLERIDGNQDRLKAVTSFASCLRKRELGVLSASIFSRMSFLSVLDSRKYSVTESYKVKGKVLIENNLMVKVNEREVYDLAVHQRLCTITALRYKEQIQCCLCVDSSHGSSGNVAGCRSTCLVLMTNFGRIMFVNAFDGTIEAVFLLPTERFRYRKMSWCMERTSFAVFGETRRPLHGVSTHHIVALFHASPISYDGSFVLSKQDFGFANDVDGFSEFLVFFSRQPQRVIGYNISDFPLQRSRVTHHYEKTPCEEILIDPSATVTDIPKRLFAFDGNWDSIQIGLTSSIYMLHPSSKCGNFLLGDWANRPICTNDQDIFLHLDGSGRVLCVEDAFVVCYCVRTADNVLEYVEQWRRRLWVDSSFYECLSQDATITSRSGRRIKLTAPPIGNYVKDDRLILVDICFDVDNELIYVICICDMNSIVFDDPNSPCSVMSVRNRLMDKGGVAFVLDDCTGEIITVITQCTQAFQQSQRMRFSTTGITAAFELRCKEGTYVEVHRLLEMGVKERINVVPRQSRRQRRTWLVDDDDDEEQ